MTAALSSASLPALDARRLVREPCRQMVLPAPSDGELLDAIAQGGEQGRRAEELLCARFGPRIRLYGLKHLRDLARAEDLMQHVLLRLLEAARQGTIRERAHVDRFVLGTCRLSAQRMRSRQQREEPSAAAMLEASPASRSSTAVEPFVRVDIGALLHCIHALEQRAQQVIRLSFQEELSADEVASTLAMTAGNVRVVRHRALLALRRCLDRPSAVDKAPRVGGSEP